MGGLPLSASLEIHFYKRFLFFSRKISSFSQEKIEISWKNWVLHFTKEFLFSQEKMNQFPLENKNTMRKWNSKLVVIVVILLDHYHLHLTSGCIIYNIVVVENSKVEYSL